MTTDEERAALLRAIASGGFSPYDDSDGSTANTLYGWADELEQVARIREALWATRRPPPAKRWPRLTRTMRRLGLLA